jgi:hypothetical protein
MRANSADWGAHVCSVLTIVFCDRGLFLCGQLAGRFTLLGKIVSAECQNQHAASVRSPEN